MREIKYRLWIFGEFSYWGFLREGGFFGPATGGKISLKEAKELSEQFTGLKDRDGKEVYEGDIIKSLHGQYGVVAWELDRFVIDVPSEGYFGITGVNSLLVVGNVHQNKDLLK